MKPIIKTLSVRVRDKQAGCIKSNGIWCESGVECS